MRNYANQIEAYDEFEDIEIDGLNTENYSDQNIDYKYPKKEIYDEVGQNTSRANKTS